MTSIKLVQTADGSDTLFSEQHNAHYHSLNGALQESLHIFVRNGYEFMSMNGINILEIGFGTGLNATLTASKAFSTKQITYYTGVELYPLEEIHLSKLNYPSILNRNEAEAWRMITTGEWGVKNVINEFFSLTKLHADICSLMLSDNYNLIYFDAFAPDDQPEVWTIEIFEKLYNATSHGGILITYCSKGIVKQALRYVGYKVDRLPGPPGKRHILRATKP